MKEVKGESSGERVRRNTVVEEKGERGWKRRKEEEEIGEGRKPRHFAYFNHCFCLVTDS